MVPALFISKICKFDYLIGVIVFLGISVSLIIKYGTNIWPVTLTLAGIAVFFSNPKVVLLQLKERTKIGYLLAITLLIFVGPIIIDLHHDNPKSFDGYFKLLLLPIASLAIVRANIKTRIFFWGLAAGAVSAGIVAMYQYHFLGIRRAHGVLNPIIFGDLCIFYGAASMLWLSERQEKNKLHISFFVIATLLGIYGSLLSGSKGGWLALFTVFAVLIYLTVLKVTKNPIFSVLGILMLAATIGVGFPENASKRLESGVHGAKLWFATGQVTEGSVSARLELWRTAIGIVLEAPLIGVSQSAQKEQISKAFNQQPTEIGRSYARLDQFHNELLIQITSRGIFGLVWFTLIFVAPILLFRKFLSSSNPNIRALSKFGILTSIIFVEFGLSNGIWVVSDFRYVYVSMLSATLALIAVESNYLRHISRED